MNKANECTCPSGDGSLRHPCPSHPAVEQAGGDERDFQAEGAQEVPSPVSQEYDRHLISLLRKGEALPGHQEEAADEIERLRDWNNHLNNTVLPNILNPNFLMLMKGGERLLDLCTKDGKFIGVSLNDMKDVFDWMVTHARIAPDHAALAQPSPASDLDPFNLAPHAEAFNEAHDEALRPEQAEVFGLERYRVEKTEHGFWPYCVLAGDGTRELFVGHLKQCQRVATELAAAFEDGKFIAQHESIVGGLRAEITQLRQHKNDYMDAGQETYRALQNEIREREAEIVRLDGLVSGRTAERDAALARVAEMEAKLSELEKQEPLLHINPLVVDELLGRAKRSPGGLTWSKGRCEYWTLPLYAAPPAQAQHSVPDELRAICMLVAETGIKYGRGRHRAVAADECRAVVNAVLNADLSVGRACEYAGCCDKAHPGTSLCIAHHSKKAREQLLAAAPGKEGV
ncbi:hypothetical protein ACEOSB_13895 [Pseudomonas aeruginosa]|uniref:hypothetical protein n=2 Tax=Pseudomonas aeruginosa TaxID=287 RepID=UPI000B1791B7|nr:hypothetical protein [Pseudomonas aeruginosa]HBO4220101.1 hypothetical protein [Pseudomonas aeruginosa]HEO1560107.1 hypothetical protein [Pseudomonas aeruginosa]